MRQLGLSGLQGVKFGRVAFPRSGMHPRGNPPAALGESAAGGCISCSHRSAAAPILLPEVHAPGRPKWTVERGLTCPKLRMAHSGQVSNQPRPKASYARIGGRGAPAGPRNLSWQRTLRRARRRSGSLPLAEPSQRLPGGSRRRKSPVSWARRDPGGTDAIAGAPMPSRGVNTTGGHEHRSAGHPEARLPSPCWRAQKYRSVWKAAASVTRARLLLRNQRA